MRDSHNLESKTGNQAYDGADRQAKALLIHLGGLGDACLSESTFLSLSRHFEGNMFALGYTRFLSLFNQYFAKIEGIESAKWLHLFSDHHAVDNPWEQIVFIGKDRQGTLRQKWQRFSEKQLIFIEMYPEDQRTAHVSRPPAKPEVVTRHPSSAYPALDGVTASVHVEDYQSAQLARYGIQAMKKEIELRPVRRTIIYPEKTLHKKKWAAENFIELYHALRSKGVNACVLEPLGMKLDVEEKICFEALPDVKSFFQDGGVFVSNDSGMAHLAGTCGLFTVTIFTDTDPAIWHPRGRGIAVKSGEKPTDIESIEALVLNALEIHG